MRPVISCEGAPRDVGGDQGRACAAVLGSTYDALPRRERGRLRLGRVDARTRSLARDLARHFPRQAEAIDGMARMARVPRAWLVERMARDLCGRDGSSYGSIDGAALAAVAELGDGASLAARTMTPGLIFRRSAPEGGFRALEVTAPWLTGSLAGVSEAGLAVAVVRCAGRAGSTACAAPAALLVQDCLHRFESLEGALDWCLGRPASGPATLVFADAEGEIAGVSITRERRTLLRPADGLILAGPSDEDGAVETNKALRELAPLTPASLVRGLTSDVAALDPLGRRIGVAEIDGVVEWISLEAPGK
jgi:hypothetical protein